MTGGVDLSPPLFRAVPRPQAAQSERSELSAQRSRAAAQPQARPRASNAEQQAQQQRRSLSGAAAPIGQNRYFVYIQERFSDLYCFLERSIGVPIMKDNFNIEECVFVNKDIDSIRKFLVNLSKEKGKSITFSLNSIKIN